MVVQWLLLAFLFTLGWAYNLKDFKSDLFWEQPPEGKPPECDWEGLYEIEVGLNQSQLYPGLNIIAFADINNDK